MYTVELKGKKYTIEYKEWQKCLIPVDKEDVDVIPINHFGTLTYLVRSSQVSEAIQEWEERHNTKLMSRG